MRPAISVIIPTYNRIDSLKKAIESVLNQTYQNFELLVCDDGSTDGSEKMVKSITDSRVRWIPGENSGGPAVPRNRGIKASKADWLAFLDSDDLWALNKLQKQFDAIEKYKVKAVCTNAQVLKNNIILEEAYFKNSKDTRLTFEDLLIVNNVICSSMLIKKSLLQQVGGFPEDKKFKVGEDYVLWLSASMLSDIYYMKESLTAYRDEPNKSIRGTAKESERIKHNRVIIECLKRTEKVNHRFMYIKSIIKHLIKYNLHTVG